ncbi:hypothetical protein PIB30_069974, partial [Stylosanthes scabra]|nr:hypothetical protein [Stylosanthes scabra]
DTQPQHLHSLLSHALTEQSLRQWEKPAQPSPPSSPVLCRSVGVVSAAAPTFTPNWVAAPFSVFVNLTQIYC